MAKIKSTPIVEADFLEYLNSYSDFSFELSVLKMLREHNLRCEHGGHYEDPVTNKSREFDIRATKTINNLRIRMSIECKNIRENFPLLISCVPRHESECYHQIAIVKDPDNGSAAFMPTFHQSRAGTFSILGEHSLYKLNEPVGKSTAQIGRLLDGSILSNDSELYEKWGQCLSSAADLVQSVYWDGGRKDVEERMFSAVFPLIVVPNGRLWVVSYDDAGNRVCEPAQTNRCSCFINKEYEIGTKMAGTRIWLSHVEIVTLDGMRSFTEDYLMTAEGMAKIFSPVGIVAALQREHGN